MGKLVGATLIFWAAVAVTLGRWHAWLWRKAARLLLYSAYRTSRHAIDTSNRAAARAWEFEGRQAA